ncbi:MAG: exodeoxyribonuclease V subunit gamma, partial [Ginsengibacter sp.]
MEQENHFYLEVSNSLNQLADQLSQEIKSQANSVFQPVYIVTQTEGMNSWLKLQIADSIGIAANIQFLKPNDLINKIYYLLGGKFTKSLSSTEMNWLIYKILGEKQFIKNFKNISDYYNNEGIDKDVKRMALAEKVADLFDQYQIYRPDMIESWTKDKLFTKHNEEEWQKALWMRAKELSEDIFPDKTLIGKFINNELQNPENTTQLQKQMPEIYLFGISVITEYHLQILQHLSNHIHIRFLILNPAPNDYWFEDKSDKLLYFLQKIGKAQQSESNTSNPLLTAWGKIIQDTFSILFKNEALVNSYDVIGESQPETGSLLHKIQNSIFENVRLEKGTLKKEDITDGTITIHSCFGPAREVEVLYNYLVHLVDKKKESLSSRDIVVMVSDIDLYASYVKAVFKNAPYKFPFTIADESYTASDSISNALQSILSLNENEFTAEAVVRLLDFSFIRNRCHITDTAQIRDKVDEANIRFGVEGSLTDDTQYVSWKYGLRRIMYGICISGGEEYGEGENSFFPIDNTESSGSWNVIRFVHFVEVLIQSLEERRKPKTIEGWVKYVESILNNFICNIEETTDEDYALLLNQLENYNTINELFDEEISYEVFIYNFLPTLSCATRSKAFAGGGITFCSLIPMRSIPFKVVALLGMNFDKFPRKDKKISFNLIEKERRKGDRNIKLNDNHLFLETLLSAQQYLFISYTGQNVKDNSTLPPSLLIDELMDFIESASTDPDKVREQLITKQPLHGFSKKYNAGNSQFYSYLLNSEEPAPIIQSRESTIDFTFKEIDLHKLISFLKNPFKGYYNNVLGIYYNDDAVTLEDTEKFTIDHGEKWTIKNDLLLKNESEIEEYEMRQLKTGGLPLKNMSGVALNNVLKEMEGVKEIFVDLIEENKEEVQPINIDFGDCILKGEVNHIYGKKLITMSFSKRENKYLLGAWINYLALTASGIEKELIFISQKENKSFEGAKIS